MKLRKSSSCLITRICKLLLIAAIPIAPLSVHAQMTSHAETLRGFIERVNISSVVDGTAPPLSVVEIKRKYELFCIESQKVEILEIFTEISVAAREIDRRLILDEIKKVISDNSRFERFIDAEGILLGDAGFQEYDIKFILKHLRENRDDIDRIMGNLEDTTVYELRERWERLIDQACNPRSFIDWGTIWELVKSGMGVVGGAAVATLNVAFISPVNPLMGISVTFGLNVMHQEGQNFADSLNRRSG